MIKTFESRDFKMQMNFGIDKDSGSPVSIKVVGVGGGGGNAVNRMMAVGVREVEFIVLNTDRQVLEISNAKNRLQIGEKLTRGMGAGGDPMKGERAAEESRDEIAAALKGAQMVFVATGMGGGTGTGAAPIVAEIAHDMGILTIAVVTKPFEFEGSKKMVLAEEGIARLRKNVDSLLVIPNERLLPDDDDDDDIPLAQAFAMADDVLRKGVQSISDLIQVAGEINLDLADITSVMKDAGYAHMGVGEATGKDRATVAAQLAIESNLLEGTMDGARRAICNISATSSMGIKEIKKASALIKSHLSEDVQFKWGAKYDESLGDVMRITIIATDFEDSHTAFDIPDYTFKNPAKPGETTSSYIVPPQPEVVEEPVVEAPVQQTEEPVVEEKTEVSWEEQAKDDDDDGYAAIMSFFNKKR